MGSGARASSNSLRTGAAPAPALVAREHDVSTSSPTGVLKPGEILELGDEAPKFEIVRSLGEGGMAEVFLARCTQPAVLPREVAVKCMVPGQARDEEALRSFLHEAKLALQLHHPNIAEAYALVQRGDRCHLLLEYVDGVTLKEIITAARGADRRPSEGLCCHVAASVADALQYAHTRVDGDGQPLAIVHRDVKPSNVMIASSGAVKLLDFGIALARLPDRDRTMTGVVRGTYSHLSPEQAAGGVVDGRSDLFSLGILLVELLTGIRPLDGDDLTPRTVRTSKRAHLRVATRRLSPRLVEICEKAMARGPDRRFQDGAELSRALRTYMVRRGIVFSPTDCVSELRTFGLLDGDRSAATAGDRKADGTLTLAANERPGSWARRRWMPAVVGGAACLVAVLGVRHAFSRSGTLAAPPSPPASIAAPATPPPSVGVEPRQVASLVAATAPTAGNLPAIPDPPVRPKKAARAGAGSTNAATARRPLEPPASAPGPPQHRATLPRGTLVAARLTRALDATAPGPVEAVVTEDLAAGGGVVVPKGSVISCRSRPSADGRVPLSCQTIKTSSGIVSFTGMAVGEGQHVGLRVLDTQVAAGTSFVVYVSASDVVR